MKVTGQKKLIKQLGQLAPATRKHVSKAIRLATEEGVKVAKTLAPEMSGQTKEDLHSEYHDGGMTGVVVAIKSSAPRSEKDRAYSIEHGRKKGDHGTTIGSHHIHRTRQYLAKKNRGRIRRAINKAAKEATNG